MRSNNTRPAISPALAVTARRMVRIATTVDPDLDRGARFEPAYERLCAALAERGWLAPVGSTR